MVLPAIEMAVVFVFLDQTLGQILDLKVQIKLRRTTSTWHSSINRVSILPGHIQGQTHRG